MSTHQVCLPYKLGSNNPIPNLFEGIVPHFSDQFFFKSLKLKGETIQGRVETINTTENNRAQLMFNWFQLGIGKYNLFHTGAKYRVHDHISRLIKIRNPRINHVHTFRVDLKTDPQTDPTRNFAVEKRLAEKADKITAVSEHTATTVREHFGIDPIIIYNGVDTEWFTPDYDRPALLDELGVSDPIFLFVGSLEKRKRPSHVLEIAAAVPEATFLLVGDGPLSNALQDRASELSNVILPGRVSKEKLPAVYANVRGLVFPTVREGCPNVVLEAMAAGIPTVGYRATSMPELIEHGERGLLADTDDVDGLISCVNRLLNSDEAEAMGTHARAYVQENHTFDKIATQYESLYTELLE